MKLNRTLMILIVLVLGLSTAAQAQRDKSKRPSPPAQATAEMGPLKMVIDYSSPAAKRRQIWGALVPYGQIWRTGANEATTIEISQDILVVDQTDDTEKKLPAGKYALFTIPGETSWTFIFNKKSDQWGAYDYNEQEDALRIEAKPGKSPEFVERMTFEITTRGADAAWVNLAWENLSIGFTVKPASNG